MVGSISSEGEKMQVDPRAGPYNEYKYHTWPRAGPRVSYFFRSGSKIRMRSRFLIARFLFDELKICHYYLRGTYKFSGFHLFIRVSPIVLLATSADLQEMYGHSTNF